jgi:plasmid stabilization system protein ParE
LHKVTRRLSLISPIFIHLTILTLTLDIALASFPGMGRRYDDLNPGLRGLPLEGYIILYRILEDGIEIVRVANGRQDLRSLFDQ